MRFEQDELTLIGGVRHGRTLGSPVAIEIGNTEWPKWEQEMSPAPGRTEKPLTQPRPGHADLAGMQKYGFADARDVLERASARETAARVAAGTWPRSCSPSSACGIVSHVVQLGPVGRQVGGPAHARPTSPPSTTSEVRCFDPDAEAAMVAEIKAAAKVGDSLGGVVEVIAYGVPVGLGSHVHWDRKLDGSARPGPDEHPGGEGASRSATASRWPGAGARRPTTPSAGTARPATYRRETNRAGGIEGGMTNGRADRRPGRP